MDIQIRVETLEDLAVLVEAKKQVYEKGYKRMLSTPKPAAFVINLSGSIILSLIREGLYVYNKKQGGK